MESMQRLHFILIYINHWIKIQTQSKFTAGPDGQRNL